MSIHVSVMTAELTGRTLKAALRYCEVYRCATVKELYDAVRWSRRPAGVGDAGRRRLQDAMLAFAYDQIKDRSEGCVVRKPNKEDINGSE